ncbi:hypothetical protein [Parazoarcus communis]|uniref:hypothetical protein n=1 Tax=Parazoarcus communis TaxID=41977 RepID=UPI0010579DC1|nr:hypothetical protein [Parazoarcus communis]NMG71815.1 hypothetical protein [Parazoarcus communis SWub3 = DSM 12120]
MNENDIRSLVFTTITPLWIALHEKGLIPLHELALYYEDALARRRFELGESDGDTQLAQELASSIHKLAAAVQARGRAAKGGADTPPSA